MSPPPPEAALPANTKPTNGLHLLLFLLKTFIQLYPTFFFNSKRKTLKFENECTWYTVMTNGVTTGSSFFAFSFFSGTRFPPPFPLPPFLVGGPSQIPPFFCWFLLEGALGSVCSWAFLSSDMIRWIKTQTKKKRRRWWW